MKQYKWEFKQGDKVQVLGTGEEGIFLWWKDKEKKIAMIDYGGVWESRTLFDNLFDLVEFLYPRKKGGYSQ